MRAAYAKRQKKFVGVAEASEAVFRLASGRYYRTRLAASGEGLAVKKGQWKR
jgi:hypothetical protein